MQQKTDTSAIKKKEELQKIKNKKALLSAICQGNRSEVERLGKHLHWGEDWLEISTSIGRMGSKMLKTLMKKLLDDHLVVRESATKTLITLGKESLFFRGFFIEILRFGNDYLRVAMIPVLEKLSQVEPNIIGHFLHMLEDKQHLHLKSSSSENITTFKNSYILAEEQLLYIKPSREFLLSRPVGISVDHIDQLKAELLKIFREKGTDLWIPGKELTKLIASKGYGYNFHITPTLPEDLSGYENSYFLISINDKKQLVYIEGNDECNFYVKPFLPPLEDLITYRGSYILVTGCYIHVISSFPSNLKNYTNSYILVQEQNQLWYIPFRDPDERLSCQEIEVNDWEQFSNDLSIHLQGQHKCLLSYEQINRLIIADQSSMEYQFVYISLKWTGKFNIKFFEINNKSEFANVLSEVNPENVNGLRLSNEKIRKLITASGHPNFDNLPLYQNLTVRDWKQFQEILSKINPENLSSLYLSHAQINELITATTTSAHIPKAATHLPSGNSLKKRQFALRTLGNVDFSKQEELHLKVVNTLINILEDRHEHKDIRNTAIQTLEKLTLQEPFRSKIINLLMSILNNEYEDGDIHKSAIQTLRKLEYKTPEFSEILAKMLKHSNTGLLKAALEALLTGDDTSSAVNKALIIALNNKEPAVRQMAAKVLEATKNSEPTPEAVITSLRWALKDDKAPVRQSVLEALENNIGSLDPKTVEALSKAYQSDPSLKVRWAAMQVLVKLKITIDIDIIINALKITLFDNVLENRQLAAKMLNDLNLDEAKQTNIVDFLALNGNSGVQIRQRAAEAFENLELKQVNVDIIMEVLDKMLKDSDSKVRCNIAKALEHQRKYKGKNINILLSEAAKDSEVSVRMAAVAAALAANLSLEEESDPIDITNLLQLLGSDSSRLHKLAMETLIKSIHKKSPNEQASIIKQLLETLDHQNTYVNQYQKTIITDMKKIFFDDEDLSNSALLERYQARLHSSEAAMKLKNLAAGNSKEPVIEYLAEELIVSNGFVEQIARE